MIWREEPASQAVSACHLKFVRITVCLYYFNYINLIKVIVFNIRIGLVARISLSPEGGQGSIPDSEFLEFLLFLKIETKPTPLLSISCFE